MSAVVHARGGLPPLANNSSVASSTIAQDEDHLHNRPVRHHSSRERSEGEETIPHLHDKVADAAARSTTAPLSSAVPEVSQGWQRRRSSILMRTLNPEGERERLGFVDRLPKPSVVKVVLTLCAYALLLSDVPRAGSSVDQLPFEQLEPNVFSAYGPKALPAIKFHRNGTTVATIAETTGETITVSASEVPAAVYKFAPSSYGLRTILDLIDAPDLAAASPTCLLSSLYDANCGSMLSGSVVFNMLDSLVEAVVANAASTTSYKTVGQTDEGVATLARGELSALPQRVRFAARAKARWTGTTSTGTGSTATTTGTSFLSRHLLDHKYWLSAWATVFNDLNATDPGVDLCVDDLDRPLFCEKPWAASLKPDSSDDSYERLKLWDVVSDRVVGLQEQLNEGEILDVTLIEAETDPLTRLGGAVLLAYKIYSVVAIYRVRECVDGSCRTLAVLDERVEGRVLYTDALEWSSLSRAMRYIAQFYVIARLLCLAAGCYLAAASSTANDQQEEKKTTKTKDETTDAMDIRTRVSRALRVFFVVPTQVVVYGSWLPILCYASAHVIDAVVLYELENEVMERDSSVGFWSMTTMLAVRMRSVWIMALLARARALLQTSAGAWTPAHGVSGARGHLLPILALGAVGFVARDGLGIGLGLDDRDARILEANQVEPIPTLMLLRAETLDSWKMNLVGVYNDLLALGMTAVVYVAVVLAQRALTRWYRRRSVELNGAGNKSTSCAKSELAPEPLFFARSAVPSAAGALWEPSCLAVSWGDDLLGPLHQLSLSSAGLCLGNQPPPMKLKPDEATSVGNGEGGAAAAAIATAALDLDTQRVLMNLVFLSDPWNLAVVKLGRTRVYLFRLRTETLDCKMVHAHGKAQVAREYGLALEQVELLASFRAAELAWDYLITCK